MSISSALVAAQGRVADAYTAISNKGGTLPATQNLANMPAAINSIPSGGSSGGTGAVSLTRFSDDNGTEIGTHFMNFVDGNGNKYKVIVLDAKYRGGDSKMWLNFTEAPTDMPIYDSLPSAVAATETATNNTQTILDYCTAAGRTSSACSQCRSKSFTIGGTTYYGQLPNITQMLYIILQYYNLDSLDPTSSSHPKVNFNTSHTFWSSSQASTTNGWITRSGITSFSKAQSGAVSPVLEIPF